MVDTALFYLTSFIAASLGLILIGVIIFYLRLVKKFLLLKESEVNLRKELNEKIEARIAEADQESKKILQSAYDKSKEIISSSQLFDKQEQDKISDMLARVTNEEIRQYSSVLQKVGKVSVDELSGVVADIKKEVTPNLGKIEGMIEAEIKGASIETKRAIQSAYTIVEKELADYKKEMFAEVDKLVLGVVKELSHKILGKTLLTREQEDLIIDALKEAKEEHIIN